MGMFNEPGFINPDTEITVLYDGVFGNRNVPIDIRSIPVSYSVSLFATGLISAGRVGLPGEAFDLAEFDDRYQLGEEHHDD